VNTVDTDVTLDDGARDANGKCLAETIFFPGRQMKCREAGTQTAWQNCCDRGDKIVNDSQGSFQEINTGIDTLVGIYHIAEAAYTTYAATGSVSAAASSAGNAVFTAFDPYSLVIAAVVSLVLNWIANSCDQNDTETAMLKNSGFCYQTGRVCLEEWWLFGCVQTAATFCCFNSKMARIVHEQGRPQVNGFTGTPTADCRGFTETEFSALDFSAIDFTEYYDAVQTATQTQIEQNMTNATQNYTNNLR
jgi:conjugal transfer mating pair stabilization protein TraN